MLNNEHVVSSTFKLSSTNQYGLPGRIIYRNFSIWKFSAFPQSSRFDRLSLVKVSCPVKAFRGPLEPSLCLFNQRSLLSDAEPVLPINSRKVTPNHGQHRDRVRLKQGTDHAALMLTSGSSGNSKDVFLKHGQILAAIAGNKSFSRNSSWTSIERD